METNKDTTLRFIVILVIIVALGTLLFVVNSLLVKPADKALTALEEELYEATPEDGYGIMVKTHAQLGEILAGPKGQTLYTTTLSDCLGTCLDAWKPYIVSAPPDEEGGLVGVRRRGNAYQQTYNSIPLYYFKADQKPEDAKGHAQGGIWFAARP